MMSSTKLIIHKFEGSTNFKTLNITIQDYGSTAVPEFSEWQDGKTLQTKKDGERSARLVVKIVSGLYSSKFGLDSCARELKGNVDTYISNYYTDPYANSLYTEEHNNKELDYNSVGNEQFNSYNSNIMEERNTESATFDNNFTNSKSWHKPCNNDETENNSDIISPLEHSLEKVKENNARIMENIHLLNRTLNYTKKREILDIVCPKSMRSFPCETCGKCFVYETGLRRHYSLRHAVTELQPRWQVVWTCIQCFQVWPRQDQAIKHSSECYQSENPDCVRDIKTSSLLQCEFCEKVFTSIPRLLRHSKVHTTSKNYECNACSLSFLSYKAAEQHWMLCPWLNKYYCFYLPKLLLCNACDRKFRNYDQLYNHRYKVGHFMTKTYLNNASPKSLGVLVYQCELCVQWFPSILPLKTHKSQYHANDNAAGFEKKIYPCKDTQESYYVPSENEYDMPDIENINQE